MFDAARALLRQTRRAANAAALTIATPVVAATATVNNGADLPVVRRAAR